MGDLAVPVYVERAGNGNKDAVDNLAAIGTPAAARELVRLLSADAEVASLAAWRIASLIRNPDIEDALRTSEDLPTPPGPGLPAVWEPFREQSSAAWLGVMGRVAYLINETEAEEVPSVLNTDRRLAIPLCSVEILQAMSRNSDYFVGPDLTKQFRAIRRSSLTLFTSDADVAVGRISRRALNYESNLDEDFLQSLMPAVLRAINVRRVHFLLFAELTPKLQYSLFAKGCSYDRNVELSDWPGAFIPRHDPRILRAVFTSIASVVGASLFILAVYSTIKILTGSWNWGPSWLAWTAIGFWALEILAIAGFILEDLGPFDLEDTAGMTFVIALLPACGFTIFYASVGIRQYLGWEAAIGVISFAAIVVCVLGLILRRRTLAAANPLRGLLEIDEAAARHRTSIIA